MSKTKRNRVCVDGLLDLAIDFEEHNQFYAAIETYNKATAIDPDNAAAWVCKANSYLLTGDEQDAIEAFDKAIEVDPSYSDAMYYKGLMLLEHEQYEEAIEAYDKALAINPNDSDAAEQRIEALEELGRF